MTGDQCLRARPGETLELTSGAHLRRSSNPRRERVQGTDFRLWREGTRREVGDAEVDFETEHGRTRSLPSRVGRETLREGGEDGRARRVSKWTDRLMGGRAGWVGGGVACQRRAATFVEEHGLGPKLVGPLSKYIQQNLDKAAAAAAARRPAAGYAPRPVHALVCELMNTSVCARVSAVASGCLLQHRACTSPEQSSFVPLNQYRTVL